MWDGGGHMLRAVCERAHVQATSCRDAENVRRFCLPDSVVQGSHTHLLQSTAPACLLCSLLAAFACASAGVWLCSELVKCLQLFGQGLLRRRVVLGGVCQVAQRPIRCKYTRASSVVARSAEWPELWLL